MDGRIKDDDEVAGKGRVVFEPISSDLAEEEMSRVCAYPNPVIEAEAVVFKELPARAHIRIFNMVGELVRELIKDGPGDYLVWKLQRQEERLAAGAYICVVEDLQNGARKVLRVMVLR